jgi:hypothetical protein
LLSHPRLLLITLKPAAAGNWPRCDEHRLAKAVRIEFDHALLCAGEKAQMGGNTMGVGDYDKKPSGGAGAESTTPAGEGTSVACIAHAPTCAL